jgi:chorismate synthase
MSNSIGKIFVVTSFGESHGNCIGIMIDGCPAGLEIREEEIQREVDRRKPMPEAGSTARTEADKVEIWSGCFNGKTTGTPIAMIVRNKDTDYTEYEKTRFIPRPGHADYPAFVKYGGYNDYRGGGQFSGRITVGFVMAGAVARKLLARAGIAVIAHTIQIGNISAGQSTFAEIKENTEKSPVRCADQQASLRMIEAIGNAKREGDSLGGIIEAIGLNLPTGLGEPIFETIEGELAKGIFAIPAVKGIEFGSGFNGAGYKGSVNNDPFDISQAKIVTTSNNAGGILGGISTGMPLVLRAAIKPTPSISQTQKSVDMQRLQKTELKIKGRHDACIVPRAVPVIEAMVAIILADFALRDGIFSGVLK